MAGDHRLAQRALIALAPDPKLPWLATEPTRWRQHTGVWGRLVEELRAQRHGFRVEHDEAATVLECDADSREEVLSLTSVDVR